MRIESFRDIIERFRDRQTIADGLNIPYQTVNSWHARDYIPACYWPEIINLATTSRLRGVSRGILTRLDGEHQADRLARVGDRRLSLLGERVARRG